MTTAFSSTESPSSLFQSIESEAAAPLRWPTARSELTTRFGDPKELGRGGFGQVFRAFDDWLKVEVAVKISTSQDRLVNEVQRLRTLPKQYFVQTFDYGRLKDIAYYSMEVLLERDSWFSLNKFHVVMESEKIGYRERVLYSFLIIQRICYGLTYLHNNEYESDRYFHGDLKPDNIFFNMDEINLFKTQTSKDDSPLIKIIDLGVSRRVGEAAGGWTPRYAAPEQIARKPCKETVDTYSIGRIFLFLLEEIKTAEMTVGIRLRNRLKSKIGEQLSTDVMRLLKMSLHRSPAQRSSCEKIGDELLELFGKKYKQPVWRIISELSGNQPEMRREDLTRKVAEHLRDAYGRYRINDGLKKVAKDCIKKAIDYKLIERVSRGSLRLA